MENKLYERLNELKRLSQTLSQAERHGLILVNKKAHEESPYDPYPIFFTPEQLIDEILKGNWIGVEWAFQEPAVIKTALLKEIDKLQQRLVKL